jgi:hypothetical protein
VIGVAKREDLLTQLSLSSPLLAETAALLAKTQQIGRLEFDHVGVTATMAPDVAVAAPDLALAG